MPAARCGRRGRHGGHVSHAGRPGRGRAAGRPPRVAPIARSSRRVRRPAPTAVAAVRVPSPIASAARRARRARARARVQPGGIGVSPGRPGARPPRRAGASTTAARTRTRPYPPPPKATQRPPAVSCASWCSSAIASRWPSTVSARFGERVLVVGVAAALGDQHVRANARSSAGTTAWNARSQPASSVPGGSATLTDVPSAVALADSVGSPVPGEQRARVLVQADREHPRVVVERGLHAVAVVHVDVDVGDALAPVGEQPCGCRARRR